jgi:hypothetical protein
MWPRTPLSFPYPGMNIPETTQSDMPLDLRVGDVEWAVELIDTYRAGDIDSTVEFLGEMLTRLRKAAKARRMLATVEPVLLREALGLAATRGSVQQ